MSTASLLRCFTPEEPTGRGLPTQLLTARALSSLCIVNADSASLWCFSSSFSSFSFSAPSDNRTLRASLLQVAEVLVRGSAKPRLNSPLKMSLYVCRRMSVRDSAKPRLNSPLKMSLYVCRRMSVRGSAKPRLNSPLKMSLYVCSRMWAFSCGGICVFFSY